MSALLELRDLRFQYAAGVKALDGVDLEVGTEWNARSLGFSARFSSMNWSGDRRSGMPIEVELSYLHTTSGSDGFVPEQNIWQVGLRYYQRIFR